jgi:hypothetical protein
VTQNREVISAAHLSDPGENGTRRYDFSAVMSVNSSVRLAREALTDYPSFQKMIPFVRKSNYDSKTQTLELEGGLWGFTVNSFIRFEEASDKWIKFRVVKGHFTGMTGDIFLEPNERGQTLIYIRGDQVGSEWPPKFIIERGAEMTLTVSGRRMRGLVEDKKIAAPVAVPQEGKKDEAPPQPRSRI